MSKLVCIHGLNKGDEFPVHEGKNVVGRTPDCSVTLFDKKCSRNHCVLYKKGQHYSLEDQDSRNGTLLNGKRLTKKARSCNCGDQIKIGKTVMVLSDRGIGGVASQTADDVAAELQQNKFGKLLTDASVQLSKQHGDSPKNGLLAKFKSLLTRN